MGNCGASKGNASKESAADLNFKELGVWSCDDFFNKSKGICDALAGITEPLQIQKDAFFEVTGFDYVPGASKTISFIFRGTARFHWNRFSFCSHCQGKLIHNL
jgi:hypothetical protein